MKKIIAATLALTLSMSMGNFVYAADDSSAEILKQLIKPEKKTQILYIVLM